MGSLSPGQIAYQQAHAHESRAATLIGVEVTFTVIAFIAVALRLISRALSRARLGLDDFFTLVTLLFCIALTTLSCLMTRYGLGKHVIAVSPSDGIMFGKLNFAWGILYYISIGTMKIAILMNLNRIFATHGTPRVWIILLWVTVAWSALYSLAGVLVILLECDPISGNWDPSYGCKPKLAVDYANVFDIVADFAILLLPQSLIWRLNLNMKQKLRLSFLFLLGSLIIAISIARIPLLKSVQKNYDATWYDTDPTIITTLQPIFGVILSSVIILPHLVHQLEDRGISLNSLGSAFRGGSSGSHGSRGSKRPSKSEPNSSMNMTNMDGTTSQEGLKKDKSRTLSVETPDSPGRGSDTDLV